MRGFRPAPQPLWLWEKSQITLYVAVLDTQEDIVYFLSGRDFFLNQNDMNTLKELVLAIARLMIWGSTVPVDWFRDELLGRGDLNPTRETQASTISGLPSDTALT